MTLAGQRAFPFIDEPIAKPVDDPAPPVSRTARIAAATRVSSFPGEEGRTRHHGKQKKGRPGNAEMTADDLRDAMKELVRGASRLAKFYETPYPTTSARNLAKIEAGYPIALAIKYAEDVLDRLEYDRVKLTTPTEKPRR